jgi:hypothetical protein
LFGRAEVGVHQPSLTQLAAKVTFDLWKALVQNAPHISVEEFSALLIGSEGVPTSLFHQI